MGVSALAKPHTGDDGGGGTERNHPVPKEGPTTFLGFMAQSKGSHLVQDFLSQLVWGQHRSSKPCVWGGVYYLGAGGVAHCRISPACQGIDVKVLLLEKKHIGVDNVLADKPDVKTQQDNVTESLSCSKREVRR